MALVDALANRSGLALVRQLADAPGASADQLAEATNLHLNTVRSHLRRLESAGVIERAPTYGAGPGRPAHRYRLRGAVVPPGDEALALGTLLGDALTRAAPQASQIREAGLAWGRRASPQATDRAPERRLREALEPLGFAVDVEGRRLQLRECPCPLVARREPALVCQLVDAVVDGALEGTSARVAGRRHDPARRNCAAKLTEGP
jgi:predicted ArsR family transcriptional regulator